METVFIEINFIHQTFLMFHILIVNRIALSEFVDDLQRRPESDRKNYFSINFQILVTMRNNKSAFGLLEEMHFYKILLCLIRKNLVKSVFGNCF